MRVLASALLALAVCAPAATAATPTLFPSDQLTVADPSQITGRRVNLPMPDCAARASDCNDIRLINQLDGFDVDPRVEIGFGQPIDVAKVTDDTIYIEGAGGKIGLGRLVWSPARNTLYGAPKSPLTEDTTYRLVVAAALSGTGASTSFTTMSVSSDLAKMRRQLDDGRAYDAAGIAPVSRGLTFAGMFPAATVEQIVRVEDKGKEMVEEMVVNTAVASAGTYAFGSFRSPSWLTAERVVPAVPTKSGEPKVQGSEEVGFALILPAGQAPADGWPVAVFGPGITRSKYDLFLAADGNARRGIATFAIDPVGHAYGKKSETVVDTVAGSQRFSAYGRGFDQDGDGDIEPDEGVQAPRTPHPLAAVALRDGLRQTALDNMALIRAIGRGVDVNGDGEPDLRKTGIVYYAQSLGGIYGTMLMASEPLVKTGVLNVPGGPILEIARLSPAFRERVALELRNRKPPLLNGGRDGFTESQPLYVDPPMKAPAQGAVAIQETGSRTNWVDRAGSPDAYAPLLRKAPLADVGAKRIFYQFAFGDQTVPNPTSATLMRAGALADVTTYYRNDRTPTSGSNPHGFLLDPRLTGRNLGQEQVLDFLASDGATLNDPDGGAPVFEVPVADLSVLEQLNYALAPATGEPAAETAGGPVTTPAPRLRIRVTPRTLRARRRTRVRIRVTAGSDAVRDVTLRLGKARAKTSATGRATLTLRLRRPGTYRLKATARGYRSATFKLRVKR